MNIAYLISVYTDAPQLKRLVEALHPDAQFFIHVDKKSDIRPFTAILHGDNIHYLPNRIHVHWGTITQVDFQIALIQAALEHPQDFDYIFFLSGQDYPLWSVDRINTWLQEQNGKELLSGVCINTPQESFQQQQALYQSFRPDLNFPLIGETWNRKLGILYRKVMHLLNRRKKLTLTIDDEQWQLYKGADYWAISQQLAQHILYTYQKHPEIRRYFSDSFAPSETMIQTIAFNSPQWAAKCLLWEGEYPGLAALTPLHFIIYDPIIKIMDESDYDTLINSGKMFTRKLVSGKSDRLVKLLHQDSQK